MAVIGTLAVKVVANAGQLFTGLGRAATVVSSFGIGVDKAMQSIAGSVLSLVRPSVASTLALAGLSGGMVYLISHTFTTIHEINKLADSLGASTEQIVDLQQAAKRSGTNVDAMGGALHDLNSLLGDAQAGSYTASIALARVGISAESVAKTNAADAFRTIAESIQAITDPVQRAAAAYSVWGSKAAELLPVLSAGAQGIDAAAKKASELGLAFSRIEGGKVDEAAKAMGRIKDVFDAVVRQFAIQLAPMLEQFANWLEKSATEAVNLKTIGIDAFSAIAGGVSFVIDSLGQLQKRIAEIGIGLQTMKVGFAQVGEWGANAFKGIGGAFAEGVSGLGEWTGLWRGMTDEERKAGAENIDFTSGFIKQLEDMMKAAEGIKTNRGDDWKVYFDSLRTGATSSGNAIGGLSAVISKWGEDVEKARLAASKLAADRFARVFAKGQEVIKETESPLESFAEKMNELNFLLGAGAVSWQIYGRAASGALSSLEAANHLADIHRPEALQRGTGAAQSAVNNYEDVYRQKGEDPQERVRRVLEQSRDIQQRQERLAERTARALESLDFKDVKF
jgi:hypothetical protein